MRVTAALDELFAVEAEVEEIRSVGYRVAAAQLEDILRTELTGSLP
jgi:hypothetical protein